MAIVNTAGTIYVDAPYSIAYTGRVKVNYIILTSDLNHATCTVCDGTDFGSPIKLSLKEDLKHSTKIFDFSSAPLIFQNGIYIKDLMEGCSIMFITTTQGSNS